VRYEKPEILVSDSAIAAVQSSQTKGLYVPTDSDDHATSSGYEADE